jgi:hypothetical protein
VHTALPLGRAAPGRSGPVVGGAVASPNLYARPSLSDDLALGLSVVVPTTRATPLLPCVQSLADQSLDLALFEVIVVGGGTIDSWEDVIADIRKQHPLLNLRSLRLGASSRSRLCNAGLVAASRQYSTVVIAEGSVSQSYLAVLLARARPNIAPQAEVVGVTSDGTMTASIPPTHGGVAVATSLALKVGYDESLADNAEELFRTSLTARYGVAFESCPLAEGAVYYRTVDDTRAAAIMPGFDIAVKRPMELAARLEGLADRADDRSSEVTWERIEEQARVVHDYLAETPADHFRVVELLDRQPIFRWPYAQMNAGLARDLVIAYAFPPYADTSAVVMAKRVRVRAKVVDVISNEMGRIREVDETLRRISGPFVARTAVLGTPTYFSSWNSMERFAVEGIETIRQWDAEQGPYKSVYSRAHFAASHFLAAVYKLSRPGTTWVAEFSDPLSRDVQGRERGTPVRRGALERALRRGMRRAAMPLPASRNCFVWCEEIAYALADQLVFTNEHQMEYMLGYCSNAALAATARRKATIDPHPILSRQFYAMVERDYVRRADSVHLAYFGNFYPTRSLDDVLVAMAALDLRLRDRLRLHVFTANPKDLERRAGALGISDCVEVEPYVRYLEFLNLTTKFDCLIVNDADTRMRHTGNPYLPSKWSDYRGSGTPIWGLVEPGSALSTQALDYITHVGDVPAAERVLADFGRRQCEPRA